MLNPDGELQIIDYSNSPFARPDMRILVEGAQKTLGHVSCAWSSCGMEKSPSRAPPCAVRSRVRRTPWACVTCIAIQWHREQVTPVVCGHGIARMDERKACWTTPPGVHHHNDNAHQT